MAAVADAVVERYLHADYRAAHPQVAAALRARLLRTDPAGLRRRAAMRSPTSTGSTAWRRCACRRSSSPARATPARRPRWRKAIAERIAGAELRVFADASHLSVVEAGDEFHGAVSSFLASLPSR